MRLGKDKVISGVCSGIANELGLQPSTVRIITILLITFTSLTILIPYIILAIILKEEGEE